MLDNFRHIHFIGIGGSGISSLAYLAKAHGIKVTGSDNSVSPITENLIKEGIKVIIGHKEENLDNMTELVIFTEAINPNNNPEYLKAKKLGIKCLNYFEAIGEISKHKKTIAIIGTHGKTTVTAMLGQALGSANFDPMVILGAQVKGFNNKNIRIGHSEWFIVEGCEYRRSFMSISPFGAVLISCEAEHLDYYKNEEDYISAYIEFVEKIPEDGFLVYNADNPNSVKVSEHCKGKKIPVNKTLIKALSIKPKIPGDFNIENTTFAFTTAKIIGANEDSIKNNLEKFEGASRRMEVLGEKNGILMITDYAHHPTEIKATLSALKKEYGKRIICVYQPHQYARTLTIMNDLPNSFDNADMVIIPNIYEARDTEETKSKINTEKLVKMISKKHQNTIWGENFKKTVAIAKNEIQNGDLLLIMGAGDIIDIVGDF